MNTINLEKDKFENLIRGLSLLKDLCNDIDIRDGVIRQRTNDNTTVFEINLQSLLGNVNIPITSLKQKLELFRIFSGQEVEITVNDKDFQIKSNDCSVKLIYPSLEFMDNKFMSQQELNNIFPISDEDEILKSEISKSRSEKMRIISQAFSTVTIQVIFEGSTAKISAKTQSKDQFADIVEDIVPESEINATSNLVITPFIVDHEGDINFKMYNLKKNICVNEFKTSLSNEIDVNVYSRSSLVDTDK